MPDNKTPDLHLVSKGVRLPKTCPLCSSDLRTQLTNHGREVWCTGGCEISDVRKKLGIPLDADLEPYLNKPAPGPVPEGLIYQLSEPAVPKALTIFQPDPETTFDPDAVTWNLGVQTGMRWINKNGRYKVQEHRTKFTQDRDGRYRIRTLFIGISGEFKGCFVYRYYSFTKPHNLANNYEYIKDVEAILGRKIRPGDDLNPKNLFLKQRFLAEVWGEDYGDGEAEHKKIRRIIAKLR